MEKHPLYEVVTTRSGAKSIRNIVLNETMHNPVGPWEEANALYIEPSRLKARLLDQRYETNLTVFDVGLGAAANAVAAIRAAEAAASQGPKRTLHIVSFEKDLDLLAFAIANAASFPHFEGLTAALKSILKNHHWTSPDGGIVWDLFPGDFKEQVKKVPFKPQIVFHDPYSPGVNPEMWDITAFKALRLAAGTQEEPTTLYTYSIATPIRAAMLLSGFYVGHGPRTGLKHETTQASTHLEALPAPLEERWLQRWLRSHTKYPFGVPADQQGDIMRALAAHSQFSHTMTSSELLSVP